jgi:alpha-L-fucosidase
MPLPLLPFLPLILTPLLMRAASDALAEPEAPEATETSEPASTSIAPVLPIPTVQQAVWQRLETTLFVHFGVNTFTDQEWGDGKESPLLFDPKKLDATQWARAAKSGGFKLMMLTAKHHDGFCLFPSRFTEHSVKNSAMPKRDVVREFVTACRAEDLLVGLYLSPWDRNAASYGDSPRYNEHFKTQLLELLTQYGPIAQIWFDGANGEGPNGKTQEYDWDGFYTLIRKLQPNALISITGPDVRWVGNESGVAKEDESSVSERAGESVWWPAECDVSIRPGWFYHPHEDRSVRSVENLVDLYFQSVGRNSVLLLNVPPNRDGLFAAPDLAVLEQFGNRIRTIFANNLAKNAKLIASSQSNAENLTDDDPDSYWAADAAETIAEIVCEFDTPTALNLIELREPILLGERVRGYEICIDSEDGWVKIASGKVIGNKKCHRLSETVTTTRLKITITEARGQILLSGLGVYLDQAPKEAPEPISLAANKIATASDTLGEFVAAHAVDSNSSTRWATNPGVKRAWFAVDLGAMEKITRVEISEALGEKIQLFAIEYQDKAQKWKTAIAGERIGPNFAAEFPEIIAQHVRLNIIDTEGELGPSIFALRLY